MIYLWQMDDFALAKPPEPYPDQPLGDFAADIDRNQLIEEDKRYRREVAKKNAAKAQLVGPF